MSYHSGRDVRKFLERCNDAGQVGAFRTVDNENHVNTVVAILATGAISVLAVVIGIAVGL